MYEVCRISQGDGRCVASEFAQGLPPYYPTRLFVIGAEGKILQSFDLMKVKWRRAFF